MSHSMQFDAVAEAQPGPKWRARWERSWPEYRAWYLARNGANGPGRQAGEAALCRHMPELLPIYRRLCAVAGNGDREARFLSTWCPPPYLGGCSVAAQGDARAARLVRNYDLSPDLNEGLLLRSCWNGRHAVMGMVEFLWGLSDGVNEQGLAIALAFGGSGRTAPGFGITTILRYVLEVCGTVGEALEVLARVPSHMAYNLVLLDASGRTASVEMTAGGGMTEIRQAIATNHQGNGHEADRPGFTRTLERRAHLGRLLSAGKPADALSQAFLQAPLFQTRHGEGFGTLFTAEYDPRAGALRLLWPDSDWQFSLGAFREGTRLVRYTGAAGAETERAHDPVAAFAALASLIPASRRAAFDSWIRQARSGAPDWSTLGTLFIASGLDAAAGCLARSGRCEDACGEAGGSAGPT